MHDYPTMLQPSATMGIKGLMKLIADVAPGALKEREIDAYFGRKVAIDASMSLYQFLIAVRSGPEGEMLTNENGEVTSHLQGMFYRTIRMIDSGIKPAFVFDGKPPTLKGDELHKRKEKRAQSEAELKEATESGNQEEINKMHKRLTYATKEHNMEARRLLTLMGVPIVEAPSEAEAQCAALCAAGKVYAVATEDMDCLTFGSTIQLRHLTASAAKKLPICEIELKKVLEGFQLTQQQFVDLCILCGCDYTNTIRGIGPNKALKLIQDHKTIEAALATLDKEKYKHESSDFLYKEAAALFANPEITPVDEVELVWKDCDEDGLIQFLCHEKGFAVDRVQAGIKRLRAAKQKGQQSRMDTFFLSKPVDKENNAAAANGKRKADAAKGGKASGKAVGGQLKKAKASASTKKK